MGHEDLPVFIRWYRFTGWLLEATAKFPKRVRFSFVGRIDTMALDVLENIIEAAYTRDKTHLVRRANLTVEKMRVLIRLCHEMKFMGDRSYKYAVKELYETGRMLGGWRRQQERR